MYPIDIEFLRNNPEQYREVFKKRFIKDGDKLVDQAIELDKRRRSIQRELDNLKSSLNKYSKAIGILKQFYSGKISKEETVNTLKNLLENPEEYLQEEGEDLLKQEIFEVKQQINDLEEEFKEVTQKLIELLYKFPNTIDPEVPIGPDDSYNIPIRFWGIPVVWNNYLDQFKEQTEKYGFKIVEVGKLLEENSKYILDINKLEEIYINAKEGKPSPNINFNEVLDFEKLNSDKIVPYILVEHEPKHHYDITKEFDLVDTDKAGTISGSRFYFEKNDLALMDLALSMYGMRFYRDLGYNTILVPPYMIRKDIESKITYYEAFKEAIYHIVEDELVLITTSEHPICAYYMNETFNSEDLPLKILAWSPAFRKEAGSHGKDTKGIFRTHQFHKVELHIICKIDEDKKYFKELVEAFEKFIQSINLPYRIVLLSSGDMDKRATIQYDLEAWFPGQGKYRELGSIATMRDWVSRKVNIKVRDKGEKQYVANLYSTGCAVQRTLCCILENYYSFKDNIIYLPKQLEQYIKT